MAFNIDPVTWKNFTSNENTGFGYKVIQKGESLLVSDPLIQHSHTQRGKIYDCSVTRGNCVPLAITVPDEAVNMSLGLSMSLDPQSSSAVVCGPTIPKNCDVTTYNGMCFKISSKNVVSKSVPSTLRECPTSQIDIAFLMDGSGSVHNVDFNKMKVFVIEMIKSFIDHDTQFAIAQFSTNCEIHHKFQVKNAKEWEDAVTRIRQQRGWTNTTMNNINILYRGARPSASKILVVITDGKSTEQFLNEAVQQAQEKNITQYAIGVGNAFNNVKAAKELAIIASLPTNKHVFKVTDFDALESIREQLKENIIAIEGYSLAIATAFGKKYAVMGAPRHKHTGQVTVSRIDNNPRNLKELDPPKPQIGSYFGAEVCVVDLNRDSRTVLLLVSAPTYIEPDREGKVFVYTFNHRLVGITGQRGRFGSSLASPADLNGDGYMDVLIGAPLEEDGQGSIYIFNGGAYQINPTYSQRIAGSSVRTGLRFFGISLSQSSLDQSKDSLPDIAVGAMGAVLLLRSRPIIHLETKVTYNPSKIPTGETERSLKNTMKVCFTMSLTANINYTIILDAKRQKYRAYFSPKNRFVNDVMNISLNKPTCKSHPFLIDNVFFHLNIFIPQLDFEINCGSDDICVDDLRMDFNFSGSTNIEVGIMQEINVTVFVENRGENSYNTLFTLSYPFGLSYRRIISKQGRVECVSLDSEQKGSFGETTCHISKPILKGNSQAVFHITYSISKENTFDQNVKFTARINSGNDQHSQTSELFREKSIGVKYGIYIALIRHEDSTLHINFTAQKFDSDKPVKQILKVENDFRELSFKVFIRVPVMLGDKSIWANKNIQIPGCVKQRDERPVVTDFVEVIRKERVVNCSVAVCAEFSCDDTLSKNERKFYNITGNVSSGWIEQTGLRAAVFQLVSSASLDYDKSKYVFFSSDSQQTAWSVKIDTQVEVYEEVNLTKEIAGGVIGGLLLLALITVALYKAGFFKSHYKELLENAEQSPEDGPTTK
uniref:Integrin, alpha M (complement component 3 receptor 3 subunit), tandem duplicate 1 n=1 Tax=Cyprinus carpio carpio TaxID=630221 RepID=A0A9J7X4H0_CYPCA